MKITRFIPLALTATVLLAAVGTFKAEAKPEFAAKEKKKCEYCHLGKGGKRGFRGLYYRQHALSFKGFDEKKESTKAGVKKDAVGAASKAKDGYTGK